MANCYECIHIDACSDANDAGFSSLKLDSECKHFKNKADFVEVVKCGKCQFAQELEAHCEIDSRIYKHCNLWRGDETRNVWHKYKKYYRDYSLVAIDEFCSEGLRTDKEGGAE